MTAINANETLTGKLFSKFAKADGGDFEFFVKCRRTQGSWTEYEIALSVKDRIPDMRIEDVVRDLKAVR